MKTARCGSSRFFLALLGWALHTELEAQEFPLWEQSFGLEHVNDSHVVLSGQGYLIAGARNNPDHGHREIFVLRIDGRVRTDGAEIGSDDSWYSVADVAASSDGGAVIVGTSTTPEYCGPDLTTGYVLTTDSSGRRLGGTWLDWEPSHVAVLGELVVLGGVRRKGRETEPILRAAGEDWEVSLRTTGKATTLLDLERANDRVVVLVVDGDRSTRTRSTSLVAVDPEGEIVWQARAGSEGFVGRDLLTGPEGFHVAGTRLEPGGERIALVELDPRGRPLRERTHASEDGRGICAGRSARGDLLVAGSALNDEAKKEGILLAIAAEGSLVVQKRFSRPGEHVLLDSIVPTVDGFLVSCRVTDRSLSEPGLARQKPVFLRYRQ